MATKNFNARFQFKGDTLAVWKQANPVLLKNELAIVTVPAESGAVAQEPAILFKVGDGETAFNDLGFVSAKAADVYDWAKAASKPTYSASEISGLADYIAGEINDTDTQYKLTQDAEDGHKITLSSKSKGSDEWSVVATITTVDTVYDETALAGRVTALEGLVGDDEVADQVATAIAALELANTYATKNEVKAVSDLVGTLPEDADVDTIVEYIDKKASEIEFDDTALKNDIKKNADAIAVLNGEGDGSVSKQVSDAIAKIVDDAPQAYDTLKEISAWITDHADSASAMNGQINANKDNIADLVAMIGELPDTTEAETIVAYIEELVGNLDIPTGALASKDKVAKEDLTDELKGELEGKADDENLSAIAKSGNVNDLVQTSGDYIVFNCGSATTVI